MKESILRLALLVGGTCFAGLCVYQATRQRWGWVVFDTLFAIFLYWCVLESAVYSSRTPQENPNE